jgi:hypothetical protein
MVTPCEKQGVGTMAGARKEEITPEKAGNCDGWMRR